MTDRRLFLTQLTAILVGARYAWLGDDLGDIERRLGGRLGVAVLDTHTGHTFAYHEGERFPMCSTFKLLAVAAVLSRVDAGREQLDRRIAYGASDLLDYAPPRATASFHGSSHPPAGWHDSALASRPAGAPATRPARAEA